MTARKNLIKNYIDLMEVTKQLPLRMTARKNLIKNYTDLMEVAKQLQKEGKHNKRYDGIIKTYKEKIKKLKGAGKC